MKIQQQPDYLIFAEDAKTGEVQDFPNILRGWGVTIDQTQSKPPMEWMNGAFNRVDKNIQYLLQQGVPEWNNQVLYPVGAVIKYKNILYIAKLENDNATPSTSTTKWEKLVKDATTAVAGTVKLNSAVNSTSEIEAATPKAVKAAYDLASSTKVIAETAATTAIAGRVKLNSAINNISETEAATPKAIKTVYDLASSTKVSAETVATTSIAGRVKLNSAINSTSETEAATPKAVKTAYDLSNAANTTANAALSRSTGGIVTGNTNYTGKLQQAGSDVITIKTINNYLPISSAPIVKLFRSSGTYTLPEGCKYLKVEAIGGGGGFGGSNNASSGAYVCSYISAKDITSPVSYVVGAAGSAGNSGGNTTFLSLFAGGGIFKSNTGGAATGGMINIQGTENGNTSFNPFKFGSATYFDRNGNSSTRYESLAGVIIITEYY